MSKDLPVAGLQQQQRGQYAGAFGGPVWIEGGIRCPSDAIVQPGDGNNGSSDEDTVFALMNTSASAATFTLSSADAQEGRIVVVTDVGGNAATNAITVATEGSETIDGATSASIAANYGELRVMSDGANWFTI